MSNYKVVLIDDEQNIVKGLTALIDWEELGCQVIGTAYDGLKGLELIKELRPDIIISDIHMPYMNGLDMLKAASTFSKAKVILLSGYSEFEYAKSGIVLGVNNYILKPVDEDELAASISEVVSELNNEKLKDRAINQLEENYKETCVTLKEYFLRDFLSSYIETDEEGLALLQNHKIKMYGDYHLVAVIELPPLYVQLLDKIYAEMPAIMSQLHIDHYLILKYSLNSIGIIISSKALYSQEVLSTIFHNLYEAIRGAFSCRLTIGIGNMYKGLSNLHKSANEAIKSLTFQIIRGSNSINFYCNSLQDTYPSLVAPELLWESYKESLNALNINKIRSAIREIYNYILADDRVSIISMQVNSINIILTCIDVLNEMSTSLDDMKYNDMLQSEDLYRMESIIEFKNHVESFVIRLVENICSHKKVKNSTIVDIKNYIDNNPTGELRLITIAARFHLSPVYLSQLFKKHTGELYLDYVTTIKMNKAKQLLCHTDLMVYEISDQLGYVDSKYFSKLFQKYTQYTPSEYRRISECK